MALDANKSTIAFLKWYFALSEGPGYAVLLTGRWGCGKTWLIKKCLDTYERRHGKVRYISLYGLSSTEQLSTKLFDGTTVAGLEGTVLVFDDLERCSMPVNDSLGFINDFVEHRGFKVVIVANEDELHEFTESGRLSYKRIKEKLIGRSLQVEPELSAALQVFTSAIKSANARAVIRTHQQTIEAIFSRSNLNNLRLLRHALYDLERLLDGIKSSFRKNAVLIEHLIRMFLIYAIEIRSGAIETTDLAQLAGMSWRRAMDRGSTKSELTPYDKLSSKFGDLNIGDTLLTNALWQEIFASGNFDFVSINEALANSRYVQRKNQPAWVRLWHCHDLEDDEVNKLLSEVLAEYRRHEFVDVRIVLQVAGVLLTLSKMGIHQETPARILKKAKAYVDHLKAQGTLQLGQDIRHRLTDGMGYAGLGYQSAETNEFQKLMQYVNQKSAEAIEESYPEQAEKLLDLLVTDMSLFIQKVTPLGGSNESYYEVPIFNFIAQEDFVKALLKTAAPDRRKLSYSIAERYKHSQFRAALRSEASWLEGVATLLEAEAVKRPHTMSGAHFVVIAKVFKEIAQSFSQSQ